VLRGYLANAEKVRVRGVEVDAAARLKDAASLYAAVAYTDGIYESFPDAPPPLEDTGGPQVKDISGSVLPGISKWAFSVGGEIGHRATLFGHQGRVFAGRRHQLSLLVLVERDPLTLSDRGGVLARERARWRSNGERLGGHAVVA
jgi:outer membrane receptor protein involved in Fe transport